MLLLEIIICNIYLNIIYLGKYLYVIYLRISKNKCRSADLELQSSNKRIN